MENPNTLSKIEFLENYRTKIDAWQNARWEQEKNELRIYLTENRFLARQYIIEAKQQKHLVITPPPIIGGPIARNVDPFDIMFSPPFGVNVIDVIKDMISSTIGFLKIPANQGENNKKPNDLRKQVAKGSVFIAMAMIEGSPELEDVLDGIKEICSNQNLIAKRIDDIKSNNKITHNIISLIDSAEFIIVDLTHARPNVYWEAGYAHGIGKTPIYIARVNTTLSFDIQDYPVIFFTNVKSLKLKLGERLDALNSSLSD